MKRLISHLEDESCFLYSVTGKKIKLQTGNVKKARSLGQSHKKSSDILPKVRLILESVEFDYQLQTADQLYLPLHEKRPNLLANLIAQSRVPSLTSISQDYKNQFFSGFFGSKHNLGTPPPPFDSVSQKMSRFNFANLPKWR